MPDAEAPRRVRIADTMVLIAAAAMVSLLLRQAHRLGALSAFTEGPQVSLPGYRYVYLFGLVMPLVLGVLSPAILVLGLRRPWRESLGRPGMAAGLAALAAAILPLNFWVVQVTTSPELSYYAPMYFYNAFARWMLGAGPMVLGAWIALRLTGRVPRASGWLDRVGIALGLAWIVSALTAEVYFLAMPLLVSLRV